SKKTHPAWYRQYCQSDHYKEVKRRAEEAWDTYMNGLHCSVNARHPFEVMHHSDYGRIGAADEFRVLIPLCHDCHATISRRGPVVPGIMPEDVKKWIIGAEEAA